jgi:hypothetical protein
LELNSSHSSAMKLRMNGALQVFIGRNLIPP